MLLIRLASRFLLPLLLLLAAVGAVAAEKKPVYVGLDAELTYAGSTSAQAIRMGMLIAIEEVNQAGGVLGGRPLQLIERDHKSLPSRALENLKELAAQPDLVAVFGGRFSSPMLESLPLIHQLTLPLLGVWASTNSIVDNGYAPNYVFRLSLRDSWAMPTMLRHAAKKGTIRRAAGLCLKRAPLTQRLRLLGVRVASLTRHENNEDYKPNYPQPSNPNTLVLLI